MARSAGIPARVVTGFKGGTWNAYSGNYTIRNSDAHAWTEIWDPGSGAWLREDPLGCRGGTPTVEGGGRRRARGAHGPQLVRAPQQPARLLVPADRQLRPAVAGRHAEAVKSATDSSGKWLRAAFDGVCAPAQVVDPRPWDRAPHAQARPRRSRSRRACLAAGRDGRWRLDPWAGAGSWTGEARGRPLARRVDGPEALVSTSSACATGPRPPGRGRRRFSARRGRPLVRRRRRRASSRSTS